jgi:hypothetical protein
MLWWKAQPHCLQRVVMTAMLMMLPNSLWKAPQTVQQVA